jgi:hypothetical protein
MKKVFSLSVCIAALMFVLFLPGCHKDENLQTISFGTVEATPGYVLKKLEDLPQLQRFLRNGMRFSGGRSTYFSVNEIDTSQVYLYEWGDVITYNLMLPTKNNENYNLIVEEINGVITKAKVLGKKMVSGTIIQYSQYSLQEVFGSRGRSDRLQECLKLYFQWKPIKGFWYDPTRTGFPWNPANPFGDNPNGVSTGTVGFGGPIGFPFPNSVGSTSGNSGSGNQGGNQNGGGSEGGDCRCGENQRKRVVWDEATQKYICYCETFFVFDQEGNGTRNLDRECRDLLTKMSFIDRGELLIPDRIDEKLEECRASDPELSEAIHEMASGAITNPCRSDNTFSFNPYEMEAMLCLSGNYNKEGLEKALAEILKNEDYINDREISGDNCPCINAIWKQMKSLVFTSSDNENVCTVDILSEFLEGPLQAEIGISETSLGKNVRANTYPNTNKTGTGHVQLLYNTRIEINKDFCGDNINIDPLQVAGLILHEFIHARIYEHLYNRGYHSNLKTLSYQSAWNSFIQSQFPQISPVGNDQHQLMAQIYANDLASALWELNGNVGTPSDYLIIAWEGLQNAYPVEDRHKYDFIPDFEKLKTDFENNVQGKGRLKFNGCN